MTTEDLTQESLLTELKTLKDDVRKIRALQLAALSGESYRPISKHTLNTFVSSTTGERKPFSLRIEGSLSLRLNLSAVRAAILLVLLIDLEDRCAGGKGVLDRMQAIANAYVTLKSDDENLDSLKENLRVAQYRFEGFVEDSNLFKSEEFELNFDPKTYRLYPPNKDLPLGSFVSVKMQTSDPHVSQVLDETMHTSPLSRLRRDKSLFVPGGADGIDKLVLDFFDHKFPATQVALFHRPSFQSFPINLLERIGVSDRKIKRTRSLLEGYETGRCQFTEILSRKSFWKLIELNKYGHFCRYPDCIKAADVLEHLAYFEHLLSSYDRYSMILTDAFMEFHPATYKIDSGPIPEFFTLFLLRFSDQTPYIESAFAVEGAAVFSGVMEKLVALITSHPSTESDRNKVIKEIRAVAEHLKSKGPIEYNGTKPQTG